MRYYRAGKYLLVPNLFSRLFSISLPMSVETPSASIAAVTVQPAITQRRIPSATYRLQFNRTFTFADAAKIVSYLHDLGISDCYASPYLKATPGSMHGYDVIDHNALNPEVGNEQEYQGFVNQLQCSGMGQLLDIVPNHMGIAGGQNPWWIDILENGQSSPYASFFDIDWNPLKPELANKVLLPVLGDQYGRGLENQDLQLEYEAGAFFLNVYGKMRLPIAPRPTLALLNHRLADLERTLGSDHPAFVELQSIMTALTHLPLRTETDQEKIRERQREKEVTKRRLATLTTESAAVHEVLIDSVREFNGIKGNPHSFDLLDALLANQAYRLANWRVAAEEINYRRFFDVNELAALRAEDPAVFAATHQLVLQLFAEGKVTGFRIDHIDGLYDPAGYLRRLQNACATIGLSGESAPLSISLSEPLPVQGNGNVTEPPNRPCYLVVEKILDPAERLPEAWPIDGTSGYEVLPLLDGIFVDAHNERRCTDIYYRFTRIRIPFVDLVYESKKLIMQASLSSELNVLARQLSRVAEKDRHSRDFTLNSLTHALREIIACFPVYRTYIDHSGVSNTDRATIELAVRRAKRRNPAIDESIFDFVRDALLLNVPDGSGDGERLEHLTFVMKFQQYTGPVMAKGVEDTAFYRYHRLVSLNEVGGAPERFGIGLATFHEHNQHRLQQWPHSLVTTTTHDTKRSEDVRARINVLSEIPQVWRMALGRWSKLNKKKKPFVDGQPVPDRNDEYLFYQTLLGVWPLSPQGEVDESWRQRLRDYMRKATKEAKVHTSWINPNHVYDDAVQQFVTAVLDDLVFLKELAVLAEQVAEYGMYNALAQTLLKLTIPGVPDLYQGNELWDLSLVDPDNRRPVDYEHRRQLLTALRAQVRSSEPQLTELARQLVDTRRDGRIKLYVMYRTLNYRRDHTELFRTGAYLPLTSGGSAQTHVCAFARQSDSDSIIVAVPRLLTPLLPDPALVPLGTEVWRDSWIETPAYLATRSYRHLFTGEIVTPQQREGRMVLALSEVFADFPVALLEALGQHTYQQDEGKSHA